VKIGDSYKTHMPGIHYIGDVLLLVNGWFRIICVEEGTFGNCPLFTIEKVREAAPSDYKPLPDVGWDAFGDLY